MPTRYDHIDFTPPKGVREEAAKGLAWRREYGRGGTEVGIARARDLSNGVTISPDTARRMKAFFDRHQSNVGTTGWSPGEDGFPSNARIAWALWGSDPGWAWSRKLVEQMNAADESERSAGMAIERRYFTAADDATTQATGLRVERRAADDGSGENVWLTGYAAKFNTDSVLMDDFVEQIDPAAFKVVSERRGRRRPLDTRALFNHDENHVLGRYPRTLRLDVDDEGLRYEVKMPRSAGWLVEAVERGDVLGSSFAFTIASGGESWEKREDGMHVRRITAIDDLYDVGPVTYPAYVSTEGLDVARRSFAAFKRSIRPAIARPARIVRPDVSTYREVLKRYGRESR